MLNSGFDGCKKYNNTVDGRNPKANHLTCMKRVVNNGINYQPQLVSRISEPSTVGSILGEKLNPILCAPDDQESLCVCGTPVCVDIRIFISWGMVQGGYNPY